MPKNRIAFMPLNTYPEAPPDEAIRAAVGFAAALESALHVITYSVDIPTMYSPLGGLLLDVPELVRAAELKCRNESRRLGGVVQEAGGPSIKLEVSSHEAVLGGVFDAAAVQARYYDLSLLPWSGESVVTQELTQAVIFGSGRPAVVVPPSARAELLTHLAIAWDGTRVAARALGDALALLQAGSRVTVLTVQDEKPLAGHKIAEVLVSYLEKRGFAAAAKYLDLAKRPIAEALQTGALEAGASLLAMGGFGHSRVRDFVLGGATKGVLTDLRLPVLISH